MQGQSWREKARCCPSWKLLDQDARLVVFVGPVAAASMAYLHIHIPPPESNRTIYIRPPFLRPRSSTNNSSMILSITRVFRAVEPTGDDGHPFVISLPKRKEPVENGAQHACPPTRWQSVFLPSRGTTAWTGLVLDRITYDSDDRARRRLNTWDFFLFPSPHINTKDGGVV